MMQMIEHWQTRIRVQMRRSSRAEQRLIRLSVRGADRRLILSARFADYPDHSGALLTILEGLALWRGGPINVAISADAPVSDSLGLGAFGGDPWPASSDLVSFHWCANRDSGTCTQAPHLEPTGCQK